MADGDSTTKRPLEGNSNDRAPKRHRYDYDNTITVLVGAGEKRFTVHEAVICAKSKFFRDACSKHSPDGQEKIMRVPEARSIRAFQLYMRWAYTNDLVIDNFGLGSYRLVNDLIEVYLLGDVLDDVKLRSKTLHLMSEEFLESYRFPHPIQCHLVWDRTAPNSSLRKYVVDHFVTIVSPEVFKNKIAEYPADMVAQVAITFMERRPGKGPGLTNVEALEERLETYMEVDDDA